MIDSAAPPLWPPRRGSDLQDPAGFGCLTGLGKMMLLRVSPTPASTGGIGDHQREAAALAADRRAVKHSKKAVKRLLLENLEALRRFCFSLTGSAADGDDLAQGTIELLLKKGVPSDAPFLPWMLRVCKNHWIDGLRAGSRTQTATADELERHEDMQGGETDAIHQVEMMEVERAVALLDEDQRLVLGLVSVQGFSYRETADILGIPIGTVMSRLSRARRRLIELTQENPQ